MKKLISGLLITALLVACTACSPAKPDDADTEYVFAPSLDTSMSATVNISGFMNNFEALDMVMDGFNDYYPNVKFVYTHNTVYRLPQYLADSAPDVFMTSAQNIHNSADPDYYSKDYCLDLTGKVNSSAVRDDALASVTVGGELTGLPMAMTTFGIVANTTLLTENGLSVPTNYSELVSAMDTLKANGYTPLQGSSKTLYADLVLNMGMNIVAADQTLKDEIMRGDESAAAKIQPAFDRLAAMLDGGYTDHEINSALPADNYEGSILNFFKGNVPFYVCTVECVSGMKKRESKSDEFTANPFEYKFVYAPLGDNGAYAYSEPWYSFAVNKNSKQTDIAIEFMRYMSTRLDDMSAKKGLPSVTKKTSNTLYSGITNATNVQASCVYDGSVPVTLRDGFRTACLDFGAGTYTSASEAAAAFVCSFAPSEPTETA